MNGRVFNPLPPGKGVMAPFPEESAADGLPADEIAFPLTAFPPLLHGLAAACSEVYLTGIELPAVAGLTVLSAALGKQVRSTGAVNGRDTPCNLYTVISAPSGFGKAVANVVARPLTDANAEMIEHYEREERPMHRADVAEAEARRTKTLAELKGDKLTATGRAEAKQQLADYERIIERGKSLAERSPALYTGFRTISRGVQTRPSDIRKRGKARPRLATSRSPARAARRRVRPRLRGGGAGAARRAGR